MKKTLLLFAAMAATAALWADDWAKPVYNGTYLSLEEAANDTVYIYNTEGQLFLTEGNDWGTLASLGQRGSQSVTKPYAEEGSEWDGTTYTIQTLSVANNGWSTLFITDGGKLYVDRRDQEDYFFSFKALGSNTYQIYGADVNPTWNTKSDMADFVVGRYVNYIDGQSGLLTGTGVIYDDGGSNTLYAAGEFQTTWAFVAKASYETYLAEVVRYETAQTLKADLDQAETLGVPGTDSEKAVYANTASTTAQLEEAIASLNKKTLAYYEVVVTPEHPITISNDPCDAITAWTNGINATTWNTQTWIDASWEGFEGTTLNIWSGSMEGKAYKQLTGLPNGIYVVSMAIYAEQMDGYAFANENQKTVAGATAGKTYTVTTEVTDGTLEFGYGQDESGTNWVALDNAVVKYYGSGVEAYRFWLNGLLESAPNFNDVTVQTSLLERYEATLASVNTVETKEEILAIIPAYEAILNEIDLNVAAYAALDDVLQKADAMAANTDLNTRYGEAAGDCAEKKDIIENHTMSTEEVNAETAAVQALLDEAQQYLWNMETLTSEMEKAALVYEEFGSTCAWEANKAYLDFKDEYDKLDTSDMTAADVEALTQRLYNIEFNLQVPAEPASDENPVDYTAKIQYPDFDNGAEGWTNDGWGTCGTNDWNDFADGEVLDQLYLNLWNSGNARVYQTLTDLPEGTYQLQISAFADAEGLQVYANGDSQDVVVGQNNVEGSEFYGVARRFGETTEKLDGTVWYGNVYVITTTVGEDGIMELGARNVGGGEVWGMIDNVKLTYFGKESAKVPTCIDSVAGTSGSSVVAIYNLAGTKVSALQKGINIVKYADGTVKKFLIK